MKQIKYEILFIKRKREKYKTEDYIANLYIKKGYNVFKGNINGYRCIGVEYFWKDYKDKLTIKQRRIIDLIKKNCYDKTDFYLLCKLVLTKKGCPDLMLIKNKKIEFIEVKNGKDHLLPEQINFMLNCKYPCKVLHIIKNEIKLQR